MTASRSVARLLTPGVCGVALAVLAGVAVAAPTLIAGSTVRTGTVYSELTVRFNCDVQYLDHDPDGKSDTIRVHLETTSLCFGVPPSVVEGREMHRPNGADEAGLLHLEYDGGSAGARLLSLSFAEPVSVFIAGHDTTDTLIVRILKGDDSPPKSTARAATPGRQVPRAAPPKPKYVINLESSLRYPATGDIPVITLAKDQKLFIAEAEIDGKTWYRIRVGYFSSMEQASRVLQEVRADYPTAWIDRVGDDGGVSVASAAQAPAATPEPEPRQVAPVPATPPSSPRPPAASTTTSRGDPVALMADARRAMTAGELSRAIQIYTKVLQLPPNDAQREAQEYLALARERNGQIAHAKAEYERYLAVYPDDEGADRVRQRLAALLASPTASGGQGDVAARDGGTAARRNSPWKVRTFLSQHYRRDVNQFNEQDEIVSQSSLYSDLTIDARRRGARFDFSTRLTAGYRYDLLDEAQTSGGNDFRLSYLYADLLDTRTRLRGRLGRQTRNTGGVLGRFDGVNLAWSLTERLRFEAVAGEPVYSTSIDDPQSRAFYGVSSNFSPFGENLELGVFLLEQTIDSMTDRRALGAELRYFGDTRTLWGSVDYDLAFGELSSAFLQGSWRLPGRLTLSGSLNRRHSPFLSLGNVLIGQLNQDFGAVTATLPEDELRDIALGRSAMTTSASLGLSRPLTPRLQFSLSANRSIVDATPAWGDAPATPETEYSYYSTDLVASSLLKEGDVGILSLRYATSDAADIYSINIDSRFPFGRAWRLNPRLRIDQRKILADGSDELTYTPGLRLQYRLGRHGRIDLEAGKAFSTREMPDADLDQESYFINLGYQLFY